MYKPEEIKELCAKFAQDLKAEYGEDLDVAEDGLSASIPYYAHGRMISHFLDLEMMAKTALVYARRYQPET